MSNGIYSNLIAQLNKLHKHNRQGSIKTKLRYYEAMKRFCLFLANVYHLEKLSNIAPKHIHDYLDYMQDNNLTPATIKTDLVAIRFFHDKISNPIHKLPDNSELDFERRSFGKEDRTWTNREFELMITETIKTNRQDYTTALTLAYYAGLRIEELFTIDTSMAEKALREGSSHFTAKAANGEPYRLTRVYRFNSARCWLSCRADTSC